MGLAAPPISFYYIATDTTDIKPTNIGFTLGEYLHNHQHQNVLNKKTLKIKN